MTGSPSWESRNPGERERLALLALSYASERSADGWVDADAVVGRARDLIGAHPRRGPTAVGMGLVLSRAARRELCEARLDGYMNRYRPTRGVAV